MIDPVDVKRSYRFEQGFTFEVNLWGDSDELRQAFVDKRDADSSDAARRLTRALASDVPRGDLRPRRRGVPVAVRSVRRVRPRRPDLEPGTMRALIAHEQRDRRVGRARTGRAHDGRSSAPRSTPKRRGRVTRLDARAVMAHDRPSIRCPSRDGRARSSASASTACATAALTNNWTDDANGSSTPGGLRDARRCFDVVVESAVDGLRKPDPRIYELVLRAARRATPPKPCSSTTSASTSSPRARWA